MKSDGRRNGPKWQRRDNTYHYHNKYATIVAEWRQKSDKKSDKTRVKYCEMGEREQMKKSLSIE